MTQLHPAVANFGGVFQSDADSQRALYAAAPACLVPAPGNLNDSDLDATFSVPKPGNYTSLSWTSENGYEDTALGIYLNGSLWLNVFLTGSAGAVAIEPVAVVAGDKIVITYGTGTLPGKLNVWLA